MNCPKCKNELGTHATYCPCGWTKRSNPFSDTASTADCAHAPACNQPAMCKIKTDTGWANLCDYHYNDHFTKLAKANCEDRGLTTTPQLRAAFLTGTASLMRRMRNSETLVQREPGEDWDEPPSALA